MLEGLVQHDFAMTIGYVLDRLRTVNRAGEIVTYNGEGLDRASYAHVATRVEKLAHALRGPGVKDGDRVATLAWHHQRHSEAYLPIPAMRAVLARLNLLPGADHLAYIANHAE